MDSFVEDGGWHYIKAISNAACSTDLLRMKDIYLISRKRKMVVVLVLGNN
jgi:hypothetical protein